MQSRILISLLVCFLFFLSSCAIRPRPNIAGYEKILNFWVGKQIDKLIAVWGYPEKQFIATNGGKTYVYERSRIIYKPTYHIPSTTNLTVDSSTNIKSVITQPGVMIGGGIHKFFCVIWIGTNNEGIIINWNRRGNYCNEGELK